jgi:16S rRNA (guanine527-N7)-methyltransferase
VKRADLEALAAEHGLDAAATAALGRLLSALADEPAPPTTVIEPAEALDAHVADSLSGLEVPQLAAAGRIADLGSGAGFPGLPLAVVLPHARVDLIESTRRKCDLIERLAAAAGAANARAIPARAEDWARAEGSGAYAAVTARALAALPVLVEYAAPLLALEGVLVAWKGARRPDEERAGEAAAAEVGLEPTDVRHVVPFTGARDRHLHVYRKTSETPRRFPRRTGVAAKRPLA